MSDLIRQSEIADSTGSLQSNRPCLPIPRVPITIRPGTMDDLPFMDELQKKTTRQVGWMPTKQFEGKIKAGHVLIAETADDADGADASISQSALSAKSAVGYCIGNDQYFKRDDVGIIYQINVTPKYRRSLVAASLLLAQFEQSAYGCKLYCCWCAQDIEANRFWESMGFVALAYRVGSMTRGKKRVDSGELIVDRNTASSLSTINPELSTSPRIHLFWQKRIRQGDVSTPWWFPAKTNAGAIRGDRIVLPIPPGVRWDQEMPVLLPSAECRVPNEETAQVKPPRSANRQSPIENRKSSSLSTRHAAGPSTPPPPTPGADLSAGGLHFPGPASKPKAVPKKPASKQRVKADPRLVTAARELRDKYLEQLNAGPGPTPVERYAISRVMPALPLPSGLLPEAA